jgi:branched-chain amino acid transport system substrate-binding protein
MNSPCRWRHAAALVTLLCAASSWAAQVTIGQVAPLEGLESFQGQAYSAGLQMAFDHANAADVATGHTFRLVRKDDGDRTASTLAQTLDLLREAKPLALAGYFGKPGLEELLKSGTLQREKIALVGYRAPALRTDEPFLYNVRADLHDEIRKMVEHLATVGIRDLGAFYEHNSDETALMATLEDVAKSTGTSIRVRASHPTSSAQVSAAVRTFLEQPTQAILVLTSGAPATGFIEQYRMSGGNALLFAQSGTDFEQMAQRLGYDTLRGVTLAQVTPSPYRISGRLTKEFGDLLNKSPASELMPSYAMMEGFIAGRVIVEAVRRIGSKPLTREAFVTALESIRHLDLGGYVVDYRAGRRSGSRFVELSIIGSAGRDRGKIRQ